MLQRAASNAYSWWWASNIRTKQSKWLDGNLQEMEEKVKNMIKLIEVDADSFAKKAEIYFRRRPELINFVEETYRSYKALADRYDRISGDLHKANHTLVSAFPDQFQLSMQEDDEDGSPKAFTAIDTSESRNVLAGDYQPINLCNRNTDPSSTVMKRQYEKINSNVTNESAANGIDRLQKEILVLQTEKEFVKSSYESSMAKFWEIEGQIAGLQEEVCALQDEFGMGTVIEDDEARALMAATAIKSCEESLVRLQRHKKKSSEEASIESKRIREARNRLQILKGENSAEEMKEMFDEETGRINDNEEFRFKNQGLDLNSICLQVKEHFQNKSQAPMVDLAEWVDELAEKVISMDVKASSQTAQIQALRSETDQLQKHLQGLEEKRANLITGSVGLRQVEDELNRIQDLEKNVHDEKQMLETHFAEVYKSFINISEKLHSLSHNERSNTSSSNVENLNKSGEVEKGKKVKDGGKDDAAQVNEVNHVKEQVLPNADEVSSQLGYFYEKIKADQLGGMVSSLSEKDKPECRDEIPGWQEMKEQIQELKTVNSVKEQEIRALRMKLFSRAPSNGAASSQKKEGNEGSIQVIKIKADAPAETTGSEEGAKLCNLDQEHAASLIVEKFRAELDALLDEDLGFWLRFSTSYHQIRKFEASFKGLQADLKMLKDSNKEGRSSPASPKHILKLDTRSPLDEKLRELHTELQVWLEQNGLLKEELQCRFKNLCQIEEEISRASRDTEGSKDYQLTPCQAAKFQGELLHMQHENNKVTKELQTGLDHAKGIQSEVANDLSNLRESLNLSISNRHHRQCHSSRHVNTKSKVPLRTFLFGEKRKKQSFFSCISPTPNRHHQDPS